MEIYIPALVCTMLLEVFIWVVWHTTQCIEF